MLRVLLGEWGTGRLNQWQFALYYVAIVGALAVWAILIFGRGVVAISAFETDDIKRHAGGFGFALIGSFLLIAAAWFNIVVKRGRDAGIPGILSGLGFLLLLAFGGLPLFGTILLAALPTAKSVDSLR